MAFGRTSRGVARRAPRPSDRGDALHLLDTPGCPICRSLDRAVARWLVTYENESRTDLAMRERLGRSFGFCPPHTRALLDQSGASASWLARWLFADVARAGARVLRAARVDRRGGRQSGCLDCPLCTFAAGTTGDALSTLARGLAFDDVTEAFRCGDGPCVAHGSALLAVCEPRAAGTVAEVVRDRLDNDLLRAYPVLTGSAPDVSRRRRLADGFPPGREEDERFRADCCPLCASMVETERSYLRWLGGAGDADAKEMNLCSRHLADLGEVEPVVVHLTTLWGKRFQAFLDRSSRGPARQSRLAAAVAVHRIDCRACDLRDAAVKRTREVLRLAAADPACADRIAHAHGVCLRHGLAEDLPGAWLDVLRARVSWLAYELGESERKSAREARWEERGPEETAWRRAPALLTGV